MIISLRDSFLTRMLSFSSPGEINQLNFGVVDMRNWARQKNAYLTTKEREFIRFLLDQSETKFSCGKINEKIIISLLNILLNVIACLPSA